MVTVTVACSGDDAPTDSTTTVAEGSASSTTLAVDEASGVAIPDLAEGEVPVGPYYDGIYTLDVGNCFNQRRTTSVEGIVDFVLRISCDLEHDHELFFDTSYPAPGDARYPGEDEMRAWALQACYAAFEDFVGVAYEDSVYELGYDHPTQEYFEDSARSYRGVRCWITTPKDARTGSAAGVSN